MWIVTIWALRSRSACTRSFSCFAPVVLLSTDIFAMSLASSSDGFEHGVVVIVNMYLSRGELPRCLGDMFTTQTPLQAYVVHSDKQGLGTDPQKWDRQSNTLGVVLIPCPRKPNACVVMSEFPCMSGDDKAIGLVKDFEIPDSFRDNTFPQLIHLPDENRGDFFEYVYACVEFLASQCRESPDSNGAWSRETSIDFRNAWRSNL